MHDEGNAELMSRNLAGHSLSQNQDMGNNPGQEKWL